MQAGCYDVPKLRISFVAINLAKTVGKHISPTAHFTSAASKSDQSISSESDNCHSDNDHEEERSNKDSDTATAILTPVLNCEKYPLLHHHRLNIHNENICYKVVHELLKL